MTVPVSMRAVLLTGHGDYGRLAYREDVPVPRPGAAEVLVRVAAAAVNNTDVNTRIGWYARGDNDGDASWLGQALQFPRIQGADACGRIVAVGAGVRPARIGERVLIEPCLRFAGGRGLERPWYFGSECDGGFAEYAVVDARHAHRVRSRLSDVELASFPCSYSTAENMLQRARVRAGDAVVVTGASGGVGSAAVQLAKARGARVVAVTGAGKEDQVRALGAAQVIGRSDDPARALGRPADVVVDTVAGEGVQALVEALRPGGRYMIAGAVAGPHATLDLRSLYLNDIALIGCTVLGPGVFKSLIAHIEHGRVAPVVARTYPLAAIAEAQAAFLARRHVGKIGLTIPADRPVS